MSRRKGKEQITEEEPAEDELMIDDGNESVEEAPRPPPGQLKAVEELGSESDADSRMQGSLRSEEQLEDLNWEDESSGSESLPAHSVGGVILPPSSSFLTHGNRSAAIRELEKLSEEQLVDRIRQVEEWSDVLKCAEAYEIQRGMALNIFDQ